MSVTAAPAAPLPRLRPTCDASVGLLDVVEPERRQVQHLSSLHAAAQGPCPPVLRVLLQVRVQGVQGDPRDLKGRGGGVVMVIFIHKADSKQEF